MKIISRISEENFTFMRNKTLESFKITIMREYDPLNFN